MRLLLIQVRAIQTVGILKDEIRADHGFSMSFGKFTIISLMSRSIASNLASSVFTNAVSPVESAFDIPGPVLSFFPPCC